MNQGRTHRSIERNEKHPFTSFYFARHYRTLQDLKGTAILYFPVLNISRGHWNTTDLKILTEIPTTLCERCGIPAWKFIARLEALKIGRTVSKLRTPTRRGFLANLRPVLKMLRVIERNVCKQSELTVAHRPRNYGYYWSFIVHKNNLFGQENKMVRKIVGKTYTGFYFSFILHSRRISWGLSWEALHPNTENRSCALRSI